MEAFEISNILDMALRRKYWFVIPFLLTLLAGLTYSLWVPRIYEAETLILVQPQKVPEEYVRALVSTDIDTRLRTITQQVTSRTNLEKIIGEYQLYSKPGSTLTLDDKVRTIRKKIRVDVGKGARGREQASSFTIAFRDKDPKKAKEVTNALASNFISENLKIRESQAIGTSVFLADELDSVKKRLMDKEEVLKQYRERYMGGLPEQLDTNLKILEGFQGQLDQLGSNLRDAENRRFNIQQAIGEIKKSRSDAALSLPAQGEGERNLTSLKNQLASLEVRYTERHPDVLRLKKRIAKLEADEPEVVSGLAEDRPATLRSDRALKIQLRDITLDIKGFRAEIKKVQSQIKWYQAKVEETPKREQELFSLKRDYNNLKESYNSLLSRKLEADIAVSMEKKQKGEQFRVIDPAKEPTRPVEPNIPKLILITLVLGLGLGAGLAYLVEMMDTSFKTPEELEKELRMPVLVSIPIRYTEEELRNRKIKKGLAATSVAVAFVLSAIGIVFAFKGINTTLSFAKKLLERI